MLRKNVKSLLEQFQVCIFAEIVFGVRCTLTLTTLDVKFSLLTPSESIKAENELFC